MSKNDWLDKMHEYKLNSNSCIMGIASNVRIALEAQRPQKVNRCNAWLLDATPRQMVNLRRCCVYLTDVKNGMDVALFVRSVLTNVLR